MWIIAKYKPKEFKILKESFLKALGEMPEFYEPKIKCELFVNNRLKVFEKNILSNYIFCKHSTFKNVESISLLKNSRGLIYLLSNFQFNQNEVEKFINFCKINEDEEGFLKQNFFSIANKTKAKFISGPLSQMIFNIIEDTGKKLKISLNNFNVTISKNTKKILYSYI